MRIKLFELFILEVAIKPNDTNTFARVPKIIKREKLLIIFAVL